MSKPRKIKTWKPKKSDPVSQQGLENKFHNERGKRAKELPLQKAYRAISIKASHKFIWEEFWRIWWSRKHKASTSPLR